MDTETQSEVNSKKLVVKNNNELVADSEETEEWEEELDDVIQGMTAEIRDWKTLCNQIKNEFKKKHKALSLAQVNQLIILSNFVTLHLKGIFHISVSVEIAQQWKDRNGFHAISVCLHIITRYLSSFPRRNEKWKDMHDLFFMTNQFKLVVEHGFRTY